MKKRIRTIVLDVSAFVLGGMLLWWAVAPLFHPGLFPTIDNISVVRMEEMAHELKRGQFPVRHVADLGRGRGYMLYNFYAPLPFYIGAAQILAGINPVGALKRTYLLAVLLAFVGMVLLGWTFFGRVGGVVSGIAYVYGPFVGYDIYWRGGVGEIWAMAWLPWVFWAFYGLRQGKRTAMVFGAISLAGLLLSHNLTTYLAVPFLVFWTGYQTSWHKREIRGLAVSFFLGLGISAFFWIPAVAEKRYLWVSYLQPGIGAMAEGLLGWNIFAVLFSKFVPLVTNWFSFLVPLAIFVYMQMIPSGSPLARRPLKIAGILFCIAIAMTTVLTKPLWTTFYPVFYIVQFPWRFHVFASLFGAFLIGGMVVCVPKKITLVVALGVIAAVMIVIRPNFLPKSYEFVDKYRPEDPCGTTWGVEYLPTWVTTCLKTPASVPMEVVFGDASIANVTKNVRQYEASVTVAQKSVLRVHEYYYPGWTVVVDGKPTPVDYRNRYGLVEFSLMPGSHLVTVAFVDTPTRAVSNVTSLVSLAALVVLTVLLIRRHFYTLT